MQPHSGGIMEEKSGRHSHALHRSEKGEECMWHRDGKGARRAQGESEESALLTKRI